MLSLAFRIVAPGSLVKVDGFAIARKSPEPPHIAHASALFPVVYDELRVLARRYLSGERRNHTLQPTALVHEAWFRLRNERRVDWNGRTHVLAVGAQAMRRLLVDHGRSRKRVKRGGGEVHTTLHEWLAAAEDGPVSVEDILALDAALTRLAAIDSRQATIVEIRFFGGLTVPEIAEALGLSTRTVEGEWAHARAWLRQRLSHGPVVSQRPASHEKYLVTIRFRDVVYTGESSGNGFWNFDPTHLVINDPIEVCVYENRLHRRRPDGKDFKTKVVRVVRDVNTPSSEPTARP